MRRFKEGRVRLACLAAALILGGCEAVAQTPTPPAAARPANPAGEKVSPQRSPISIEVNKLEPVGAACRAYFVVGNATAEALKEVRLDVFVFDRAGVVLRRVGLSFPDIRPERIKVVLFDVPDTTCDNVGRLLVNEVLSCTGASGAAIAGCDRMIATTSRTQAEFVY
jgi:hypothetical protein